MRSFRAWSRPVRALVVLVSVTVLAIALGTTGAVAALGHLFDAAPAAPANDVLASATVLDSFATSFHGTTDGAGVEAGENDVAAGDRTVWFAWTPSQAGTVYVVPGAASGPSVRVYNGAAFPLARQDSPGGDGATNFTAVAGTRYEIQVDSATAPGPFEFDIWQPTPGGPDNDGFGQAASLDQAVNTVVAQHAGTAASVAGSTVSATTQPGEPAGAAHTVWYSWTVPNEGASLSVTVESVTVESGTTLGVFSGTEVDALATVRADAPADAAFPAAITGKAGTTFFLRVGGPETAFTLTATPAGVGAATTTPPTITCTPPPGWTRTGAVACAAADNSGTGLADPADAAFTLTPAPPAGGMSSDGVTPSRTICDRAGNCAQAGPISGLEIDTAPPVISCAPTPPTWVGHQAAVNCTAVDDGGGLADPEDASFPLSTAVPAGTESAAAVFSTHPPVCDVLGNCANVPVPQTARVDLSPPDVQCGTAPPGWQARMVTITCTATDTASGLASSAQSQFTLNSTAADATSTANGVTDSVQVCDMVGNCVSAGPITGLKIDRELPVVNCTPPSGWQDGVTAAVPCTASDAGSGLADPSDASFTLHASIPAGTQSLKVATDSRKVCDVAGSCVTAGPFQGIELDDQPPVITCGQTPQLWQSGPVTVDCTVGDGAGSGVTPADSAFALTAEIPNGTVSDDVTMGSRTACDAVGNCATTPPLAPGRQDRVPPTVVCGAPGGIHYAEVTVTCTATDVGSGLADPAHAGFTLRTDVGPGRHDPAAVTNTRVVCDIAGNCVTAGPVGPFDVDRTHPAPGGPPSLAVPALVHVLDAQPASAAAVTIAGAGAIPVPLPPPTASGAPGLSVRTGCSPGSDGMFPLGQTLVVCSARDDADRVTTETFPVIVTLAPDLAPSGPGSLGQPFPVLGSGFAPDSAVSIELDGAVLGTAYATSAGALSVPTTMPAGVGPGSHTLVVRGQAPDDQPQLVVTPITLTALAITGPAPGPTLTGPAPSAAPPSPAPSPAAPSPAPSGSSGPAAGSVGDGGSGTGAATQGSNPSGGSTPTPQQSFGGGSQAPTPSPSAPHAVGGHPAGMGLGWLIAILVLALLLALGLWLWLWVSRRAGRAA